MISGSVVIFAAILSKLFLDRQLNKLHYAGVRACGRGRGYVTFRGSWSTGVAAAEMLPDCATSSIVGSKHTLIRTQWHATK